MTDNEIIKALECYIKENKFEYFHSNTMNEYPLIRKALNLINRQKAEIERLEHLLLGVMHFVDKWLDGAELKQDEVNRARAMREKTLQIVEKLEEENDFLKSIDIDKIKAEAVKGFVERFENELTKIEKIYFDEEHENFISANKVIALLVNLVREMVGED